MTDQPENRIRRPRKDSMLKSAAMLAAARELFLRDGYSNTSMDAVAQEAGVSKRTVYGHFGSKQDLFAAIIRDMCSDVLPPSLALPAGEGDDAEDHLARMGAAFLSAIYAQPQIRLFRTIVSDSRLYPEIGRLMYDGPVSASNAVVRACLDRMVARGVLALDDTALAATQFLGMLKTDLHLRLLFGHPLEPGRMELETTARRCARLFLHGALAR